MPSIGSMLIVPQSSQNTGIQYQYVNQWSIDIDEVLLETMGNEPRREGIRRFKGSRQSSNYKECSSVSKLYYMFLYYSRKFEALVV